MKAVFANLIKKGTFVQNLAITTAGNSLAYLLGLILTPFLARVYSPEAYGQYALFNSLAANISIFATLNYTNAFTLPKDQKEFLHLVQLTLTITLSVALITFSCIFFWGDELLSLLNADKLGNIIYLLPVFILFNALNQSWDYWNVRTKEFKRGAGAKIFSVLSSKTLTLAYGYFTSGNIFGLIIGDFSNKPINTISLTSKTIRSNFKELVKTYSFKNIFKVAKDYKNYPLYYLPGTWMVAMSQQLPIYILTSVYSSTVTGFYSFAVSFVGIPIQMVGMSMGYVFLQKASEVSESMEKLSLVTVEMCKKMFLLMVVPFTVFSLYGEELLSLVLGNQWNISGVYAGYLAMYYFFQMISLPLSSIYRVLRKEKMFFIVNLFNAGIFIVVLFISTSYKDALNLIITYSVTGIILQLVEIGLLLKLVGVKPLKLLLKGLIIAGSLYASLYYLKNSFTIFSF